MEPLDMRQALQALARNTVRLETEGTGPVVGRFGGLPDVPPDFVWPVFETAAYDDDTVKPRPLSFLAQFDCATLAPLDTEGLLPQEGILSFFYELDSQCWGYDPKDAGCARVYWFPDKSALAQAAGFPENMESGFRLPSTLFRGKSEVCYPNFEDFILAYPACGRSWDEFQKASAMLQGQKPDAFHRLSGWPDIIQNNMTQQCELISRGFFTGNTWNNIPMEARQEAAQTSLDGWRLLFQLDTITVNNDFELMFGDNGSIYFYIRREDLAARRFDRVWLIQQCF